MNTTVRHGVEGHYAIDQGDDLSKRKSPEEAKAHRAALNRLKSKIEKVKQELTSLEKRHEIAEKGLQNGICPHPQESITGGGFDYINEVCGLCGKSVWL